VLRAKVLFPSLTAKTAIRQDKQTKLYSANVLSRDLGYIPVRNVEPKVCLLVFLHRML